MQSVGYCWQCSSDKVKARLPVPVTFEEFRKRPINDLRMYLRNLKGLYVKQSHNQLRTAIVEEYTRFEKLPGDQVNTIIVDDVHKEINECQEILNKQKKMSFRTRITNQAELGPELDRVAALFSAQVHAMSEGGYNFSTLVMVPIEEFNMANPPLEVKNVSKICKLHASIDTYNRGEISAARLEAFLMEKTEAEAVFDSVFFPKLFDLPDPSIAATFRRRNYFNPMRFVEALDALCQMNEKELAKFGFLVLSKPLDSTSSFVDDCGIPIASDSHEVVNVAALPEQFPEGLSAKGRKKVEFNNALMTMFDRVVSIKKQILEHKRRPGIQYDHNKHGVYTVAPPVLGNPYLMCFEDFFSICQSTNAVLYPLKFFQNLFIEHTFGEKFWKIRRQLVQRTAKAREKSFTDMKTSALLVRMKKAEEERERIYKAKMQLSKPSQEPLESTFDAPNEIEEEFNKPLPKRRSAETSKFLTRAHTVSADAYSDLSKRMRLQNKRSFAFPSGRGGLPARSETSSSSIIRKHSPTNAPPASTLLSESPSEATPVKSLGKGFPRPEPNHPKQSQVTPSVDVGNEYPLRTDKNFLVNKVTKGNVPNTYSEDNQKMIQVQSREAQDLRPGWVKNRRKQAMESSSDMRKFVNRGISHGKLEY